MAKLSQQFAIIDKIKSFVKNTSSSLWKSEDNSKISEAMARKIQQSAHEKSQNKIADTFTPPYLELSKQLQVNNHQIVCAAVLNLSNIALNSPKYRSEIIHILQKALQDDNRTPEQITYINSRLAELKKKK